MTEYDAGSVYTGLAGDFQRTAFDQYDKAIEEARRQRDVKAKLEGDFDPREFDEYERTINRLRNEKVVTELRADVKGLKGDYAAAEQIVGQYERRRERASQEEVRSSAAYLREARKRQASIRAEVQDRELLLRSAREEGKLLAATAKLHGDSVKAETAHARSIANVTRASDDGSRAFNRQARATDGLGGAANRASRALNNLTPGLHFGTRIPVYKILAIGTAIASIVPPAIALAGALGPIVGILGALPTLAITGLGALTTGLLGLRGVSSAIGDAWGLQTSAANSAIQTGKQALAASRATRNAEQALADANREARRAQDDLNQAREDAVRRLEDMRMAARRARLEEENSVNSLRDAREELARLEATGGTGREIEAARQRIKDAELDVADAKVQSNRATTDLDKVERQGLSRMDEMVRARERLREANRNVIRQEEDLADAMDKASLAIDTGSSAASTFQKSMANLSPAGQRFVRFIQSDMFPVFKRLRNEAQEGLLPGLQKGLLEAEASFPVIERMVVDYADALGDAAEQQGRLFGGRAVGRDLGSIFGDGERLIRKTAEATFLWERGLIHVGVAARPLVNWLGDINVELATMFEEWAQEGRESGSLDRFFRRTIHSIEETVGALWDFGRGLINIGGIAARVWGDDLLGDINDVAERFRDWTESVRGQREIEGYFIRWRRRWRDIADAVKEVFTRYRELRREGEKPFDALTEALAEAFSRALPKIAENIAHAVPNLVEAFVTGFLHANAWGKLIIGGWLIAKFGGFKAFSLIGARAGTFLGIGMAEGAAAGVAGGAGAAAAGGGLLATIRGKILPVAKRVGIAGLGLAVADVFLSEWDRRITQKGPDMFDALKAAAGPKGPGGLDLFGGDTKILGIKGPNLLGDMMLSESERAARKLIPVLEEIAKKSRAISPARARELKEEISKLEGVSRPVRRELNALVNTAEDRFSDGREATRKWNTAVETMVRDSQGKFAGMRTNVQFNTELIRKALKDKSGAGRKALATNMEGILDVIKRTMTRGGKVTETGLDLIKRLYVNELRFYGLSPKEAVAGANLRTGDDVGGHRRQDEVGKDPNQYGGTERASGGWVGRMGERGRDMVHAVLGRGEAVLNFAQQKIVNAALRVAGLKGGLPQLFNRTRGTKHYMAGGGIVGVPGTGISLDRRIVPDAVALKKAYALYYNAGYAPTGHAAGGEHPLGLAVDAVPDFAHRGTWGRVTSLAHWAEPAQNAPRDPFRWVGYDGDPNHGEGNHLHLSWQHGPGFPAAWVKTLGGRVLGQMSAAIKRVVIGGRDSPLRSSIQGVVDNARKAANRKLTRILSQDVSTGMGPHMDASGATGSDADLMRSISEPRGWSFGDWWEVDRRETAHGTNLFNESSGAALRGQFMPGLTQGHYGPGSAPWLHPSMVQQIWSMARYIKERYGNPTDALEHHNAFDWYGGGGIVGGDGGSIADHIPFAGHFDGGGFLLPPEGAVNPSGLLSGSGKGFARSTNTIIGGLNEKISDLGNTYELKNKRFSLSDEEFINEGTETVPPSLNQEAISQRLAELEELIRIRQKIVDKYNQLRIYIRNLMRIYRTMRKRLAGSIRQVEGSLDKLKGRKGKEAKSARKTLTERLAEYTGADKGAQEELDRLAPDLDDAEYNFESSKIDLEGLIQEAAPLRGGGAGLTLPDWEPSDTTTDDDRAIADQQRRRADALQGTVESLRAGFQAFAGPGDIGQGGLTAKDAVLNPTGVPGPGYVVGPSGELIPVVSGTSTGSAPMTSDESGVVSGPTFIFPSTVPYTREQAAEVGRMAAAGWDQQAPSISSTVDVL